MFRKRGNFRTINLSGIKSFLICSLIGTSISFLFSGLIITFRVENGLPTSIFDQATKYMAAETLASMVGENMPYLSDQLRLSGLNKSTSRLAVEMITDVNFNDPRTFLRAMPLFSFYDGSMSVGCRSTSPIESNLPPDLAEEVERVRLIFGNKQIVESPSGNNGKKQVLVYNTHYSESYYPELPAEKRNAKNAYDLQVNVTQLSKYLVNKLENKGIGAERRFQLFPLGGMGKTGYKDSKTLVSSSLKQNSGLQYVIDIHRDSAERETTTIQLPDGKNYARLVFVVGKQSTLYKQNFKLATALHEEINRRYPGLSRKVHEPPSKGCDAEYNQSMSPGAICVELGGAENDFAESYRTLDILAQVLTEMIKKK